VNMIASITWMMIHYGLTVISPSHAPIQWHHRLDILQKLCQVLSFIITLECESCQFGKHHHASYPSCVNNSSSFFDLVHSNI